MNEDCELLYPSSRYSAGNVNLKKIVWFESHLKSRLKYSVKINRTVSIINVWLNRVSNNLWFHRWKNGLDEFLRRCSIWQNRCFKPPYLPIWAFLQNIFVSLEKKTTRFEMGKSETSPVFDSDVVYIANGIGIAILR